MRALSNRYITAPLNGTLDSQSSGRFAPRRPQSPAASQPVALSVFEIQARWRQPYEKPHAYIRVA